MHSYEADRYKVLLGELDKLFDVTWQEWMEKHRGYAGLWDSEDAQKFALKVEGLYVRLRSAGVLTSPASPADSAPTSPSPVG